MGSIFSRMGRNIFSGLKGLAGKGVPGLPKVAKTAENRIAAAAEAG